jgi:hypothetical protein
VTHGSPRRPFARAGVTVLLLALMPLSLRAALHLWGPPWDPVPSYLPALEAERPRAPFDDRVVEDFRRFPPAYVVIGDSMAGRLDFDRLAVLTREQVSPLVENASSSAYWYLVLKNYVAASGARPRRVIIFFRDNVLTDVMFRLDGPYRARLDQVALEREDDLNRVIAGRIGRRWTGVYGALDRVYALDRAVTWLQPMVAELPARLVAGREHERLLDRANRAFALERLRPMAQADMAAADRAELDFAARVDSSALPLMLDVASAHGLPLVFVRVLRRPEHGVPPRESAELQQYVRDLRAYITGRGAVFFDDRDYPELARLPYADGDHVAREARLPYTDHFWTRLERLTP